MQDRRHRLILAAALLLVGYSLNLWITNVLRAQAGGIDTIWTANAFVIGAILLLPQRWTPACLAAGFAIQAAVVLGFSHSLFDAVSYSLLNVVEAVVVVALARRLNAVRLTTPSRFARLIFVALLPMLIVGSGLVGLVVLGMTGAFPFGMVGGRLAAKFLGMSLVLPGLLFLGLRGPSFSGDGARWERLAGPVLLAGLAGLIFTPLEPLALLGMFPAATLVGLRLGPRAVTLALILGSSLMLAAAPLLGPPSLLAAVRTPGEQMILSQLYLAMVYATGIMAALVATHQRRLRRLLTSRSRADRRARDRAHAASIAKSDFLATMSHEIRTPLNSIIGFAQVLERAALPPEAHERIGVIRRSGDALLTVVNDILDFSKVEAGRLELDPKPVDLVRVCEDALAIVREAAERKGLTLRMAVSGEIAKAYLCDDHRLCQVLLNYLNNAVKFTASGEVTLTLSASPAGVDEGDRIRITVTDTGVGIAQEAQSYLFDRFRQVDSSISRNYGGTGLGLAIAKGIAEAMGGSVGVDSTPGLGSAFWIEVVMAQAASLADTATAPVTELAFAARVLLVDDHPVNRDLGATILQLLGCEAHVACDGYEAVEAARTGRYDVILMDLHMPGMDGLAASRAIQALEGPAALTPIVAMSADVLPEQQARMRAAGMVDSVDKPIDIANLQACLARWVGRDAKGRALAA